MENDVDDDLRPPKTASSTHLLPPPMTGGGESYTGESRARGGTGGGAAREVRLPGEKGLLGKGRSCQGGGAMGRARGCHGRRRKGEGKGRLPKGGGERGGAARVWGRGASPLKWPATTWPNGPRPRPKMPKFRYFPPLLPLN